MPILSTIVLLALAATIGAVRLWTQLPYGFDPLFFPDSPAYVQDLDLAAVFTHRRAPLVPIVHGLLGRDPSATAVAQIALSIVSWSLLAWSAHRHIDGGVRGVIAGTLILLLGASVRVSQWDHAILSESMSLSFLALVIAAALNYHRSRNTIHLAFFLAACTCWILVRDSNLFGAGLMALVLLSPYATRHRTRHAVALLLIIGLVVATGWRIERSGRWETPFHNVLAQRVLPDAEAVRFLQNRGMPVSDTLMSRAGTEAWSDDWFLRRSPELAEWRAWVKEQGRQSYALLLLSRPLTAIRPLLSDFDRIFGLRHELSGTTYHSPAGAWLDTVLEWKTLLVLGLGLFAGAVTCSLLPASGLRLPAFPIALVAISIPLALVLWHSDTNGVARHCLPVAVILDVALILFFAGVRFRPRRTADPSPGTAFVPRDSAGHGPIQAAAIPA